ncbi:No apical meristem (NAM) protein [Musa troglodytarum]|nr:No apical meristem (NAM) protein [Musa troglodytarum]
MTTSTVPPGYRFYPTEEELIGFYLRNKLDNRREDMERVIPVADVYRCDPWQLPPIAGEACGRDGEQWFFFCPRQEREANGGGRIASPVGLLEGHRFAQLRVLVREPGHGREEDHGVLPRSPAYTKTKWKMNEYRALEEGRRRHLNCGCKGNHHLPHITFDEDSPRAATICVLVFVFVCSLVGKLVSRVHQIRLHQIVRSTPRCCCRCDRCTKDGRGAALESRSGFSKEALFSSQLFIRWKCLSASGASTRR